MAKSKTTDIFDRLDNVVGNYMDGVATEKDMVDIAFRVNDYLKQHPHPHDVFLIDDCAHNWQYYTTINVNRIYKCSKCGKIEVNNY